MVNEPTILWAINKATGDVRCVTWREPLRESEIPVSTSLNMNSRDVYAWYEAEVRCNAAPAPLIDRRRRAAAAAVA